MSFEELAPVILSSQKIPENYVVFSYLKYSTIGEQNIRNPFSMKLNGFSSSSIQGDFSGSIYEYDSQDSESFDIVEGSFNLVYERFKVER